MTMPQGSTEEPEVQMIGTQSRPIHVVSSDAKPGKDLGTEFGRFRTVIVSNVAGQTSTTPGAQRLINRSLRRKEARIIVNATVAGQPVTDGILIGGRDEINTGNAAAIGQMGGYLQIGDNVGYKSQQELWVAYPASNTDSVYVTVLDMQYASDPDSYREDENR